jgi:hypothetical protein
MARSFLQAILFLLLTKGFLAEYLRPAKELSGNPPPIFPLSCLTLSHTTVQLAAGVFKKMRYHY